MTITAPPPASLAQSVRSSAADVLGGGDHPTRVLHSPAPGATTLRIMGMTRIDETPVRHTKPIEFVTALALAGGRMTRDALERRIYLSTSSDSAIPTLCYRARKLGIAVTFDPGSRLYTLATPVVIDALRILSLLQSGDIDSALDLWHGPCLPASDTPLANALRLNLERAVVDAVLGAEDPVLLRRAAVVVDSLELAEAAVRDGCDPLTAILSDSFVAGTLH